MLIDLIKNEPVLAKYLKDKCEENNYCIEIDNQIDKNNYLIIKPDEYYNDLKVAERPKSPDCIIVQRCGDNTFTIYVVELRNIKEQKHFDKDEIREKFETCLKDFMQNLFRHIFVETDYELGNLLLFFITDPYQEDKNPNFRNKIKNTRIDSLLASNTKPLYFHGNRYGIQHKLPNPLIRPC